MLRVALDTVPAGAACTRAGGDGGMRLAALKALLASVLAPRECRPPNLGAALGLFQACRAEGASHPHYVTKRKKNV